MGVDERLRLRAVFERAPVLDADALRNVTAAVLVKSPAQRVVFDQCFEACLAGPWRELAQPVTPVTEAASASPLPRARVAPAAAPRSAAPRGLFLTAAALLLVAGLSTYILLDGGVVPGTGPQDPVTPTDGGGAAAPPVTGMEPASPGLPTDDTLPVAARGALLVLTGFAFAGWLWRQGGPVPLPSPEGPPARPGPPRIRLRARQRLGRQLVGEAEEDVLVWGVGRFVTEQLTNRLSVDATVLQTAAAAGRPVLRYQQQRQQRAVWLWLDESTDSSAQRRLADELTATLEQAGLPVERARFWGVPDRLTLASGEIVAPAEMDERRHTAAVALLTDGRLLTRRLDQEHERQRVRALLRTLSNWPHLAFVDFGAGAHNLAGHLDVFQIPVVAPPDLAGFLGGGRVRADPAYAGAERAWAAALALPGEAVDAPTAYALRDALGLPASPWALDDLPGPSMRLELLRWLATAETTPGPGGLLRQALDFWDATYAACDAHARANEPAEPWLDTPAERRLRADRALLALWTDPDTATPLLYALRDGAVGDHIEARCAALTAVDHPAEGAVPLPWSLADRPDDVAAMLCGMRFGEAAGLRFTGSLTRSPRGRFAAATAAGLALGALVVLLARL